MSWSTISSVAKRTRSSAYFTVWITCSRVLKSPNFSRAFLVRHLLHKLNRINYKQLPFLTPLPVFILLVSSWSIHTLTPCTVFSSTSFYTILNQGPLGSALVWSSLNDQIPSASLWCICEASTNFFIYILVDFDVTLSIQIVSLVSFPLLNQNWYLPVVSSVFFSILLLSILANVFTSCVVRLVVWWLLHFVAVCFFCKAVVLMSVKSLGHCPDSYILLIRCAIILRSSASNLSASPGTSSSYFIHIKQILSSIFSSYIFKTIFHADIYNCIRYANKLLMIFKSCFACFVTGHCKVLWKVMNFRTFSHTLPTPWNWMCKSYTLKLNVYILMHICSVV